MFSLIFRYLWVGLAILLCVTAAGLLVFFMFPRDVVLTSTRPYLDPVGSVTVNVTKQYVNFEIIVSKHLFVVHCTCTCIDLPNQPASLILYPWVHSVPRTYITFVFSMCVYL